MGHKAKCAKRIMVSALGNEREQACCKDASQRVVTRTKILHRCAVHEFDAEFAEAQGWSVWPIEVAS